MKLLASFAALALGALAQSTSTPVVIKREACFAAMSLAFSPDGCELAQPCGFAPIEMFDTTNYRKARTFRSQIDYTPDLTGFAYSADGKTMVTVRPIIGAEIWNAADPGKPVPPENGESFKSFYGVDELYALDKPLRVLEEPRASRDEFASALDANYSPDSKFLLSPVVGDIVDATSSLARTQTRHLPHRQMWATRGFWKQSVWSANQKLPETGLWKLISHVPK
jgi:hypothetical protein